MPSLDPEKPGIATKGVYDSAFYIAEAAAFLLWKKTDNHSLSVEQVLLDYSTF
jgi:hypothetical protein